MPPKPHRVLLDRVSGYADEAAAYLRRRRHLRKPFARTYYPGGRSTSFPEDSEAGEVLASSGDPEAWGDAGRELIAAADAAGGEAVAHAHIATGEGEAFCVREGGYVAVAVTDRFTLSSLMIFDIRIALRRLAAGGAPS